MLAMTFLRANRACGSPLWGKLSPQVTDEGELCGHRPFLRRGGVTPPYMATKNHCAVGAGHCPARGITETAIYRVICRGGIHAARGQMAARKSRANRPKGFPLWGKLSPQVTDEGATTGHFPLIRRVPRHLPPEGEGFLRKMHKLPIASCVILQRLFSWVCSPFYCTYSGV